MSTEQSTQRCREYIARSCVLEGMGALPASGRYGRLDDSRLAALVRKGDEGAFEAIYERHHAPLLSFCRHMLGSLHDAEDVLQQTFLRAHRALRDKPAPDAMRPWLFAIARNRCLTALAARRESAAAPEDHEPGFDGLAEDVARRADLRELVGDLARLPDEQREALVLFELGGSSQVEIASVLGCPPAKVKALVFQARSALIAERDARSMPCEDIREQLSVARGGVLRRGLAAPPRAPVPAVRRLPARGRPAARSPRDSAPGPPDRRPQGRGARGRRPVGRRRLRSGGRRRCRVARRRGGRRRCGVGRRLRGDGARRQGGRDRGGGGRRCVGRGRGGALGGSSCAGGPCGRRDADTARREARAGTSTARTASRPVSAPVQRTLRRAGARSAATPSAAPAVPRSSVECAGALRAGHASLPRRGARRGGSSGVTRGRMPGVMRGKTRGVMRGRTQGVTRGRTHAETCGRMRGATRGVTHGATRGVTHAARARRDTRPAATRPNGAPPSATRPVRPRRPALGGKPVPDPAAPRPTPRPPRPTPTPAPEVTATPIPSATPTAVPTP